MDTKDAKEKTGWSSFVSIVSFVVKEPATQSSPEARTHFDIATTSS